MKTHSHPYIQMYDVSLQVGFPGDNVTIFTWDLIRVCTLPPNSLAVKNHYFKAVLFSLEKLIHSHGLMTCPVLGGSSPALGAFCLNRGLWGPPTPCTFQFSISWYGSSLTAKVAEPDLRNSRE